MNNNWNNPLRKIYTTKEIQSMDQRKFNGRRLPYPRPSYGQWLVFLRQHAQLSQEEVALELRRFVLPLNKDIWASTISYWERTGNLAGRHTIPALANIYNVPIGAILRLPEVRIDDTGEFTYDEKHNK